MMTVENGDLFMVKERQWRLIQVELAVEAVSGR